MHDEESQLILQALRDNRKRTVALLDTLKAMIKGAQNDTLRVNLEIRARNHC